MSDHEYSGEEMSSSSEVEPGPSKMSDAKTGNADTLRLPKVIVFDLGVSILILIFYPKAADLCFCITHTGVQTIPCGLYGYVTATKATKEDASMVTEQRLWLPGTCCSPSRLTRMFRRPSNVRKQKMSISYMTAMANRWHSTRMSRAFSCSSRRIPTYM